MSWTHLSDTEPRARREYRCCLCGLRIRQNARHVARRGVLDDKPVTTRMHAVCEDAASEWEEEGWECLDQLAFRQHELGMRR